MSRIPHKCEAFEGEFSIGKKQITANSYVKDHQKFQKIYSSIADIILGLKREGDFLEVGAGGAFLASIIAEKTCAVNITATDISSDIILKAKGTGFLTSPIEVLTLENPVKINEDCFYTHHTFMNDYSLSVAASFPAKNIYLSRIKLPG